MVTITFTTGLIPECLPSIEVGWPNNGRQACRVICRRRWAFFHPARSVKILALILTDGLPNWTVFVTFLLALTWWRGCDDVPNEYVIVVSKTKLAGSIIIQNTRHKIPRWSRLCFPHKKCWHTLLKTIKGTWSAPSLVCGHSQVQLLEDMHNCTSLKSVMFKKQLTLLAMAPL